MADPLEDDHPIASARSLPPLEMKAPKAPLVKSQAGLAPLVDRTERTTTAANARQMAID